MHLFYLLDLSSCQQLSSRLVQQVWHLVKQENAQEKCSMMMMMIMISMISLDIITYYSEAYDRVAEVVRRKVCTRTQHMFFGPNTLKNNVLCSRNAQLHDIYITYYSKMNYAQKWRICRKYAPDERIRGIFASSESLPSANWRVIRLGSTKCRQNQNNCVPSDTNSERY